MAQDNIVYFSSYISVIKETDGFYIESYKKGMSVEEFNKILGEHPEIKITSFMAIKNSILFAPKPPAKFGELKDRISIELSSDELKAYIKLCVEEREFSGDARIKLMEEIVESLEKAGVVYGVKQDVLLNELCNNKQILIAEGIPPENGEDSVVKMYEIKKATPEIKEDGKVDHYELNLINRVEVGDWLGERIDPKPGVEGKSVKGNPIPAVPGKKHPLHYDKNTVKEEHKNGVTYLFALRSGAVHYEGDKISVSNHLEIEGDLDFKTGNVDFDGFVSVKGTVADGFSLVSNQDIEILGVYGIGSVKEVISREGSIYIKGGIAGKNRTIIKAKKDIYSKFISDATIICEGSVHVGLYCINSNITAKEVIIDSPKGQISGGSIQCETKVMSPILGSPSEKRTIISVKGFNRNKLKERLQEVINSIETIKNELVKVKFEAMNYFGNEQQKKADSFKADGIKQRFNRIKDELQKLEEEKISIANVLRTRGEGEIAILKKAYPGVVLEIKNIIKEIDRPVINTTFFVQDGDIKDI
ncbi:DUF342 domain-containing protein [Acetivibrio mesophilus]|uniref:DUF342 domain-containing protein n=1 Tax=Acetivibrio mesophilus TaxID=2487273 RepID=A0A4Q0I3G4_9FIRM|nr:FapA family protein [Acetivibrio mesophilus]ODM27198.1 hypothetical protein A7W90_13800 [Clostridium sp. Bc-iso-3]RXE58768.1 DUF342 domain-containing protein [Acetivibrio mesophilus]